MGNNDKKMWIHYQKDQSEVYNSTHDRHKKVYKQVRKYLKPGSKILEIGFGDGYLLKKLSKSYNCCGADIDVEIIENASKNISEVDFTIIDTGGKLPFENDFFDGFIASEVLEHMSNEELKTCVKEIEKILKKGGYGFITVPAEENLSENECFCPNCSTRFHRWGHKQSWNINKINNTFKDFEIIQIKDYFVKYEGNNYLERFSGYIMYIIRNFINIFNKLPNRSYMIIIKKK